MALSAISFHLSEGSADTERRLSTVRVSQSVSRRDSPLGVEDAEEGGSAPVLARQREDGPQVVEGDVALGEGALQPGFLEGGPLLLQGPGAAQIPLMEDMLGFNKGMIRR